MNGQSYRVEGETNPPPYWIVPKAPEPVLSVTAALCWWNERPTDLARCVRGVANIADRIVALDGAYRRYPGATVTSPPEQAKTIRREAEAAGLGCLVVEPDRLWAGQIEKRSHLLALAGVGADWIVTVDADHIIETERDAVRRELAASTADVVEVPFHTPLNDRRSLASSAPGQWHVEQTEQVQYIPQVWRAILGLRVEQHHWWISATKNGQKVWAWAGDTSRPHLPHALFVTPYRVEHRVLFRTTEQIRASRAFCNDRESVVLATGQEDHVAGLPEPAFDYERIPA
jgi:hypothetical protein